ncbi:MAG: tetratricopeptide repeat protein [Geminicoccaceae bacterium]|nr:tetratricopeptide repeat protein [Geminicoccaceae bacterium]
MVRLLILSLLALAVPLQPRADELDEAYRAGFALFREDRYAEARPHFERALVAAEARYGENDPRIAIELNNLAEVNRLMGRFDEAEPLYLRALELVESDSGADDPGLATTMNNLALLYRAQDRLDEAERLYERSLDILQKALGPRHLNVAKSMNNLAMLYDAQGRRDRARPLIERAFAIVREELGPEHPTTRQLADNMALMASEPILAVASGSGEDATSIEPAAGDPTGAPDAAASTARAGDGAFVVHLASVRSEDDARAEWRRLKEVLDLPASWQQVPPERVDVEGKGTFYRVAGGSFADHEAAAKACATIEAEGSYCGVLQR